MRKNYKSDQKTTELNMNPYSCIGLRIVKIFIIPNLIYTFSAISIKDIGKLILRLIWRHKRLEIANIILKKKTKPEDIKIENICFVKDRVKRLRIWATDLEKLFAKKSI
jgi:hypothetical protein